MSRPPLAALAVWATALFLAATLFSHTVALRLAALGVGTLLVLAELARAKLAGEARPIRALPPVVWPFALWAAWAFASLAWSGEVDRTQKELQNEVLYAFLALFLCHAAAQMPNAMRVILPAVALAAASVCGLALVQFWSLPFARYMEGAHGGPGNHTSALLVLLPCTLVFAWYAQRTAMPRAVRVIAWGLPVVYAASAFTTLNRTVWLAFAAEIVLIGALLAWQRIFSTPRAAASFGIAAAAVLALGAGLSQVSNETRLATAADVFSEPADGEDPRLHVWAFVMEEIGQHPGLGIGFGRGGLRKALHQEFNDGTLWHAHNLFLDSALQLGLPGLALLLLLLGATLRQGWKLARDPDPVARACGVALITVLTGMVLRNMTDTLLVRQNALLYWGTVGLLLGLGKCRASLRE